MKICGLALLVVAGCASNPRPPSEHLVDPKVAAERPVCGWEELSGSEPVVELAGSDAAAVVSPGTLRATLVIAPDVAFGTVRAALAPARDDLVRIKVAIDRRWLLPLTNPSRQPPKPAPDDRVEAIVGHRRITRSKAAPRARIADIRVDGERLRLFVENDRPAGVDVAVPSLEAALRATEPPVETFVLTATDETQWRHLQTVIRAASCYDRRPGEEPHEIVLDSARTK